MILHDPDPIALGILCERQLPHAGDGIRLGEEPAPGGFDPGQDRLKQGDADSAFEAAQAGAGKWSLPLLQRALQTAIVTDARPDQVEAGRSPRLKAPVEDHFVEGTRPFDIVGMDGEMADMVGHRNLVLLDRIVRGIAGSGLRNDAAFLRGDVSLQWIRTLSVTFADGHTLGEHTHRWGQLVHAGDGAIHVTAARASWLVPPARAVWLPPGVTHRLCMRGRTTLRTIYVDPAWCKTLPAACTGLEVSPLLRELVLYIVAGGLQPGAAAVPVAIVDALLAVLAEAEALPFLLVMPRDRRAVEAADRILQAPATALKLDRLARDSGASRRTLQRLFHAETGQSIAQWQQTARLLAALACLLDGGSVTEAGMAAGYAGTSAFVTAFRRRTGLTPLVYRDLHASGSAPR